MQNKGVDACDVNGTPTLQGFFLLGCTDSLRADVSSQVAGHVCIAATTR